MRIRVKVMVGVASAALAASATIGVAGVASAAPVRRAVAPSGSPVGAFDTASVRFDLDWAVAGWAADPSPAGLPVEVRLYFGGTFVSSLTTSDARPDVAAAVPGAGPSTGWHATVGAAAIASAHGNPLCAYGINTGPGANALLGCQMVPSSTGSASNARGALDGSTVSPGLIRLHGWAADPDGTPTTEIRVSYDDTVQVQITASRARPDVNAALGLSATSGYDISLPILPGVHLVCVSAQNTGPRGDLNTTIGCTTATIPGVQAPGPHDPRGAFDGIDVTAGSPGTLLWSAKGWAFDPDHSGSITVRELDISFTAGAANGHDRYAFGRHVMSTGVSRPDVQALFPAAGPSSGFAETPVAHPTAAEVHLMCIYAADVGPGTTRLIECRVPQAL